MPQAFNIIIHVYPGSTGVRECCPKSSYCLRAMNQGEKIKVTRASSVNHVSLSEYLDKAGSLTSEGCFPWPDRFHMFSGMFYRACLKCFHQLNASPMKDDLNIWSPDLTYNYAEYLTAIVIPKVTQHSRKTFFF